MPSFVEDLPINRYEDQLHDVQALHDRSDDSFDDRSVQLVSPRSKTNLDKNSLTDECNSEGERSHDSAKQTPEHVRDSSEINNVQDGDYNLDRYNFQDTNKDPETMKNENQFMQNVWKNEVQKDIVCLFKGVESLTKDVKEIKCILKKRAVSPSVASSDDEERKFILVPNFPLEKVKHIRSMEINVNESFEYKKQLVSCFDL